jgi:hypothetical protein
MDGPAIKELERLVKDTCNTLYAEGKTFVPDGFSEVKQILPEELPVKDLASIVDLRTNEIAVVTEGSVELVFRNERGSLSTTASCHAKIKPFPFGEFMDVTQMRVSLMTMFEDTPDRGRMMVYLSKMTSKSEVNWSDDGISTAVSVVEGVSGQTVDNVQLSSILELRPYRTFFDVEQPLSRFLFRLEKNGEKIKAALFDVNPDFWKFEARTNIRKRLLELDPTIAPFIR